MQGSRHILVVDDDESQRVLLSTLLKALNFASDTAATGSEALAKIEENKPLMVLLDIGLPDIDGLTILSEIKSKSATEDIVVILISATTDPDTITSGLKKGAVDFIQKPFDTTVLQVKLSNHIELHDSHTEINRLNEQLTLEKQRIEDERNSLARYFSSDLIEAILSGAVSTKIGGDTRVASILFCDIRNSTRIAERVEPGKFMDLINNLFTDLTDIIYGEGGSVNKFIGDGILATFGCPNELEDEALHSAAVALKIRKYMANFNEFRPKFLKEPLEIGVGISRGEVFAGNVGSVHQIQYTVLGDPVNIASRLESITKHAKVDILMDGNMRDALGRRAKVMKANLSRVRGKLEKVRVYYLVDLLE